MKKDFKRAIDFMIVLFTLLVIRLIFLVIYIWITIVNKSAGAIFYAETPREGCLEFQGYFRTKMMCDIRMAICISDAQRLTKVGKFICSPFKDALPVLINI